jgi:type I protein arginine methyltransferase
MTANIYSLSGYGDMIADRIRTGAFMEALRGAIRPGTVVMDIGTGPGVVAVQACQFGASHVYAIEPCEVIQVARDIAAANHYADKIEFFEDFSTKVSIPVQADLIISDLRGILPLFGRHIPSIIDARRRFLAPGGTLIAQRDKIWTAVVNVPEVYGKIVTAWDTRELGVDLTPARSKVLNEFRKVRVNPDQLLTSPQLWATLDYRTIEDPDVRGTVQWRTVRSGIGHGILVWFDMELADGVSFSNGPGTPEAIYGSAFFPWLEPMTLAEGQMVCVDLEAKLLEEDYFWRWNTWIESAERPCEIVARFEQSQLRGAVLSLAKLHKAASDFVPQLSAEGMLQHRTLELMDGKVSLEEVARRLSAEFPERFSSWHRALSFAGALSQEYSR